MAKKKPIPTDRFSVEDVPLYKRASGILPKNEKPIEKASTKSQKVFTQDLKLCSIRLRSDQIKALGLLHVETRENVSKMVRDALEAYLSEYLEDKSVNLRLSVASPKTSQNALETKGLRLTARLIEAVRIVAAINATEKSEIVRNAVDEYLTQRNAK